MKTIVAVQCRLSSTRLPGKALKLLGGRTTLDWTLSAMKKVKADGYFLATDEASAPSLQAVAERNGFEVFVGPLEDVLERFCLLIEKTGADAVIRATADNPFLFYESANALVEQYTRRTETGKCDYITWTNLPHGSGIEILNAKSLLEARNYTKDDFDHEHVGPSLYRHPEKFESVMLPSPSEWNFPDLRTTIDTQGDYRRALAIVRYLSKKGIEPPYTSAQIVEAAQIPSVALPVLCVPCVKKGRGTGHLRRCLSIAAEIGADVFVPEDADLQECGALLLQAESNLEDWQIVRELPDGGYSLILADAFSLERSLAQKLTRIAPLAAIDEGSLNTDLCDFLLDIIPSYGIDRPSNVFDPSFVSLPKNVRTLPKPQNSSEIKSVLICAGGEDPSGLVFPTACAFGSLEGGRKITAIAKDAESAGKRLPENLLQSVEFVPPIQNLREKLFEFDLVVTHYGFTAFEALAAGCGVILLGTTDLHARLAEKYGFVLLKKENLNQAGASSAISNVSALYPESPLSKFAQNKEKRTLGAFVQNLARGRRFSCPICLENSDRENDSIVARTSRHTFKRCSNCSMLYMAWTGDIEDMKYNKDYFFDDYKKQYGKTYLDDFSQIKSQCVRRTGVVDMIFRKRHRNAVTPSVLDVGCAFGPYLDAANDSGWQVFGTDASADAVNYVQNSLHYPAVVSKFPAFDPKSAFGVQQFDSVTMWYVIEHFQNLDSVLRAVSKVLRVGGVFAFSTPSAAGVSGKFNTQSFFENSPADHYTLWEPNRAKSILKRYGFKLVKTVSTGHHPERFPALQGKETRGAKWSFYRFLSRFFSLGDTFEAYCIKERDL